MQREITDIEKGNIDESRSRIIKDRENATSVSKYQQKTNVEKVLTATGEFIDVLLNKRPSSVKEASPSLEIPQLLYEGMLEQIKAANDDGKHHGGKFGYIHVGADRPFLVVYVDGDYDEIDYSQAKYPNAKWLGSFHTHIYTLSGGPEKGWAGGGHGGDDIRNFFLRQNEIVSIVLATTPYNQLYIYCLLKPLEYSIPGTPSTVGEDYKARVLKLVKELEEKKTGDPYLAPFKATERELSSLSQRGSFVFYLGINSRIIRKK